MNASNRPAGTILSQRIRSLDLIRGIAVLGILFMNIASFSMIGSAYINPTLMGGMEGANKLVHDFNFLFANQKFMTLFSILFGAGIILFTDRLRQKGFSEPKYYYKRTFFLFIFGMIHAYLIWFGDILVAYAICGSLAFLLRKKKARTLFILGGIIFLVPALMNAMWYANVNVDSINESVTWWVKDDFAIQEELSKLRGGFMDVQEIRTMGAMEMQTLLFAYHTFWRAFSLMLIGMGLYKLDIVQGSKTKSFYLKLLLGLPLGLAMSYYGLSASYAHDWDAAHGFVFGDMFNYVGSLFTALGYLALICLWSKSNILEGLKSLLRKAGRMAFTNYILTSVICTFLFFGYGFGYVGTFDRLEQLITVFVVWLILLLFTHFYSKKYSQGPLEKLWRNLTYM